MRLARETRETSHSYTQLVIHFPSENERRVNIFFFMCHLNFFVCMFSSGQLLEEFFCYFSTEFNFSGCVVNIRTACSTSTAFVLEELKGAKYSGSDTTASFGLNEDSVGQGEDFVRNDSSADECHQKAHTSSSNPSSAMKTKCGKRVEFKISPLCVQDPFELTHNLTQNVPASLLKHIVELMKDAHKLCSEINNEKEKKFSLLDLLTVCKTTKKRRSTNCHSFFVSFHEAGSLKLATSKSVFLFIVETLEKEFGLKCVRKGNSAKRQRSCEQLSETPLSKRQRIDWHCSVMAQDTQVSKESQDTDSVNRTSGCLVNSTNIDEQENVKKTEHTDDNGEVFSLICTAFENTWTHSRRERRKRKLSQNQMKEREKTQGEEIKIPADDSQVKSGTVSQEICDASSSSTHSASRQVEGSKNVNSIASPILVFELRVEGSPQNTSNMAGCTVLMEHVESQDFQLFGNFFSTFKRHFMGLLQNKHAWS